MRKLTLRKEELIELTTDEMTDVVGGGGTLKECLVTQVCVTDPCITPPVTGLRCALSLGEYACA